MSVKLLLGPDKYCFTVYSFPRNPQELQHNSTWRRPGAGNSRLPPPSAPFPAGPGRAVLYFWGLIAVQMCSLVV